MDQKTMVDEWWWNVTVTTLNSECNEALFVYTSVQIIIVYKCKSKQLPCWGEIESVMKPPQGKEEWATHGADFCAGLNVSICDDRGNPYTV